MLYDELTALENLRYFAASTARRLLLRRNPRALPQLASTPRRARPVGNTPGIGSALLARVLQTDPELLLLDEPFSNLDVASAQHMVEFLLDFRTWPVHSRGAPEAAPSSSPPTRPTRRPLADTTLTMQHGQVVGRRAE